MSEVVQWFRFVADTGKVDRRGNPVPGFEAPRRLVIRGFDPGTSTEPADGLGHRVNTKSAVYIRGKNPGVADRDEIEVRGKRYRVDGHPAEWRRAGSDRVVGVEISLVAGEG